MEARPLSIMLLEFQLKYFAKVFRRPDPDCIRALIFQPDASTLISSDIKRRRGRPRLDWAVEIRKHAIRIAGERCLNTLMTSPFLWKKEVRDYCRNRIDHV